MIPTSYIYCSENLVLRKCYFNANISVINNTLCSCVFVLGLYYTPLDGLGFKIDQVDFTDWMSLLPPDLMEEISPISEVLNTNTQRLSSAWNS